MKSALPDGSSAQMARIVSAKTVLPEGWCREHRTYLYKALRSMQQIPSQTQDHGEIRMSSRPRSSLEQFRKNIVGSVVELDCFNIGKARGALDTDDFRYVTGETQTVTGVIAGENGGIGAGAAVDLVGARSAVDRVVAIIALDIIIAAAGVENIVPGAAVDAVVAVAAEDYVITPVSGQNVVPGAAIDIIGAPQTTCNLIVSVTPVQLGGGVDIGHRDRVVAAQTVDDVPAGDRPGQNIIAFRAVERRCRDIVVEDGRGGGAGADGRARRAGEHHVEALVRLHRGVAADVERDCLASLAGHETHRTGRQRAAEIGRIRRP